MASFKLNEKHNNQSEALDNGLQSKEEIFCSNFRQSNLKKKIAFTLAEVLITLGIIGVVAAMTIPNLMTSFAKTRTETQLKSFYSKINQALRLSVADNGDPDGWVEKNKTYTYNEQIEFLDTYMFPYMKQLGYESCDTSGGQVGVCVMLIDGSGMWFSIDVSGGDIIYFLDGQKMLDWHKERKSRNLPREKFAFSFAKVNSKEDKNISTTDFVVPYTFDWDGTKEGLKKGHFACVKDCINCGYCTELIHQNGWKIPSDYPW